MNIEVESYGLLSKNKGKKTIQAGKERPICSSCGEALKKGSTTCDVCGTVQGGAASRLSDSELESKLRSARLVSLLYMLAAPVLVIVGFAAALALLSPVTVVCLIAAVICFIIGLSYRGRMKRLVSANIVRDALSEVFEECSYSHNEHIPGTDVSEAALIPKWDEIYGSDLVEGKYKGRGIRFSDVKLIEVKERIKINGKNRDKRVIVFKGQWLVCDLGRELPSQLRVSEKAFSLFKGKSDVETESTAFNEKFRIQTDNSHTAFYILTPHFMEFILAADAKADARVFLSFHSNKMHIALQNNRDSFELKGKKIGDIPALRTAVKADIQYLLSILDELFQNDYLFEKEN